MLSAEQLLLRPQLITHENACRRVQLSTTGAEVPLLWFSIDRMLPDTSSLAILRHCPESMSRWVLFTLIVKNRLKAGPVLTELLRRLGDDTMRLHQVVEIARHVDQDTFNVLAAHSAVSHDFMSQLGAEAVADLVESFYPSRLHFVSLERIPDRALSLHALVRKLKYRPSLPIVLDFYGVSGREINLGPVIYNGNIPRSALMRSLRALIARGSVVTAEVLTVAAEYQVMLADFQELMTHLAPGEVLDAAWRFSTMERMARSVYSDLDLFVFLFEQGEQREYEYFLKDNERINEWLFLRYPQLVARPDLLWKTRVFRAVRALRANLPLEESWNPDSTQELDLKFVSYFYRAFVQDPLVVERLLGRGFTDFDTDDPFTKTLFSEALRRLYVQETPSAQRVVDLLLSYVSVTPSGWMDQYLDAAIEYELYDVAMKMLSNETWCKELSRDDSTHDMLSFAVLEYCKAEDKKGLFKIIERMCEILPVTLESHPVYEAAKCTEIDKHLIDVLFRKQPAPTPEEVWESASNSGRRYLSPAHYAARVFPVGDPASIVRQFLTSSKMRPMIAPR